MRRNVLALMAVLLTVSVFFPIVSTTNGQDKWPSGISVGSFPKGSASYPVNVAIARLISKFTPVKAVVREYAGGAPGIEALIRSDIHTWSQGQGDFYSAYFGKGLWKDKPQDIRLLIGIIYDGPVGFGVRPGEGIRSLKDLAGKRCVVKSLMPYLNEANELALRKAGVWDKIKVIELAGTADIVPAMIEKKVDCFLWAIGGAYSLEIKTAVGLDWISLAEEEAGVVRGIAGMALWKAPRWILEMYDYPLDKVLRSYAYCFGLAVHTGMPDHVAYGLLNAVYGDNHLDEVRSLTMDLKDTNIKLAVRDFWLPFHAGAVRFYKDKGVWTDAMEAKQKEFLAKGGFSK